MTYQYKEYDKVVCQIGGSEFYGEILGVSTVAQPVVGAIYIVRHHVGLDIPNETYPFSVVSVPECCIVRLEDYKK